MSSWYSSLERAIVGRAFVPELRNDLAIRRLLDRHDDPAEAWESLFARGFLPASWLSSSSRSFVLCDGVDSWRDWSARFCHTSPHPPSTEGCFHAAAGLVSLLTAEHLAIEMCRLLGHEQLPERFTWVLSPRPLIVPGEALGFAVLQRAVRVALNDWSEAAYRKRALRDLSKRRREIAKSECHRRSNLQQHALYADAEMSLLDHVLAELVASAPLADTEYVRVSSATAQASGGTMEVGRPIRRYFGPLRALLELLALGVGVGPVEHGTMYLVLKGLAHARRGWVTASNFPAKPSHHVPRMSIHLATDARDSTILVELGAGCNEEVVHASTMAQPCSFPRYPRGWLLEPPWWRSWYIQQHLSTSSHSGVG